MAKPQPPLRNLYPRITSFSTLLTAFRKASKGKRYRPDVLNFAANLEAELFQLQHELRSFSYTPGVYRQFPVREPKPRLVSAAPFRDRVVHHAAATAAIAPCAASPGLAEHRWILQADIRLHFPSIDHLTLIAQLERRIACPGTLWLLAVILANGASGGPAIDAFPGDTLLTPLERPRGLPIGNLTSQFLANLHLDALDHHLRALPGVKASLRYVDDLALFADHSEPLRQALTVLREDLAGLRLHVHP
jgi:retron-type reverse transcriptase